MAFRAMLLATVVCVLLPLGALGQEALKWPDPPPRNYAQSQDQPAREQNHPAGQTAPSAARDEAQATAAQPDEDASAVADTAASAADPTEESDAAATSAATSDGDEEEMAAIARPKEDGASTGTADGDEADDLFPEGEIIAQQKQFWIDIFAKYTSNEGVLHDGGLTQPVYEALDMRHIKSRRAQTRYIVKRKREVEHRLRTLAANLEKGYELDAEDRALLAKFEPGITPAELNAHARDVRFQRGLADRFQRGIARSGRYMDRIRAILREEGVPVDLAYLPHVESSFNHRAYSKFGAAGIWQFTRSTGNLFMDIGYEVDERLDPLIATRAAAKFLRRNYERLGAWPLAITAYNHGPQGMERIVARMDTHDLNRLIESYHGRLFKFASKNFYAEFLAAREVAKHRDRYFGPLEIHPPLAYEHVKLPFYLSFDDAVQAMGVSADVVQEYNPSLRQPVLVGSRYIPRGHVLRVPQRVGADQFLQAVPASARKEQQKRIFEVRVARGDTLYDLGRRHGVPWRTIARANNISQYHRLRPGQRLVIPYPDGRIPEQVAEKTPRKVKPIQTVAMANVVSPESASLRDDGEGADESIAFQRAEGTAIDQELALQDYDRRDHEGYLISQYGETLGHYADWAEVATQSIRNRNGLCFGCLLRPGRKLWIPLASSLDVKAFDRRRTEYHQSREEDFFSVYGIAEVREEKVQRGDSVWSIAQSNNVPMWLFYRQNQELLEQGTLRVGMTVQVPVIEELSVLQGEGSDSDAAAVQ